MKRRKIIGMSLMVIILFTVFQASAQTRFSLRQLIDAARKNNHELTITEYQIQEKIIKLEEDKIKQYPLPTLEGNYQYNFNLPELTIPAGSLGTITMDNGAGRPLPEQNSQFSVGQKGNYYIGLNLYQPLTQQFKITTGLSIDRVDIKLLEKEQEKTSLQVQLAIEQFYYNALITQKKIEGEKAKLTLAKVNLNNLEGKFTTEKNKRTNTARLRAEVAGQGQNILELEIQLQDFLSEISILTGLHILELEPEDIKQDGILLESVDEYKSAAFVNPDMEIARLNKEKALLDIQAAKQSKLPDLGFMAGYYVQQGNPLLPTSSPYLGITFKWNMQDLFSSKQVENQKVLQLKQAEETIAYTERQVESDINKAWRKVKQSASLVSAATQLVSYCKEALKDQQEKEIAENDIKSALLEIKSQLAEAEISLYHAQLSKSIAMAQLKSLNGQAR